MKQISTRRRLAYLLLINVCGVLGFAGPIALFVYGVGYKKWILALCAIGAFFVLRRFLFLIENKYHIYSPSNPKAELGGPGVTLIAPWLKRENKREDRNEQ
jgi:hypothetical protein